MRRSLSFLLVAGLLGCSTSPPSPIQPKGEFRRVNAPRLTDAARPIPSPVAARPLTPQEQLAADLKAIDELGGRIARNQALVAMAPMPPSTADLAATDELQARIAREFDPPPPRIVGAPVFSLPPLVPAVVTVAPPPAASVAVVAVFDYQDAPTDFAPPDSKLRPAKVAAATESGLASEPVWSETLYVYPDVLGAGGKPMKLPVSSGVIVVPDIVVEPPPRLPKPQPRVTLPARHAAVMVRSKSPVSLAKNPAGPARWSTPRSVHVTAPGPEFTGAVSMPIVSSRSDEKLLEGAK